jgi:hypothetical protein
MRVILLILLSLAAHLEPRGQVKYENDFEKAQPGSLPEDFLVLEGAFSVKEVANNKVLELPGAPLDTYGLLFGPAERENVFVSARFFAESKGRRYPVFEAGLNGVAGYKLRVSPGKKQLELLRSDTVKKSEPLEWQSGKWTHLKLQLVKGSEKEWKIEGRIWQEGSTAPAQPTIAITEVDIPSAGRASIGAMPYSGTPIWFDDLKVGVAK